MTNNQSSSGYPITTRQVLAIIHYIFKHGFVQSWTPQGSVLWFKFQGYLDTNILGSNPVKPIYISIKDVDFMKTTIGHIITRQTGMDPDWGKLDKAYEEAFTAMKLFSHNSNDTYHYWPKDTATYQVYRIMAAKAALALFELKHDPKIFNYISNQ